MDNLNRLFLLILLLKTSIVFSETSPDQFYDIYSADSLIKYSESVQNLTISDDGLSLVLEDSALEGNIVLKAYTFNSSFNRGLPSWNGSAPDNQSSGFKIEMRFLINNEWSDWLMVGYWDRNIWRPYGKTDFEYGKVDIDYVKLDIYSESFQYKVSFKRGSVDDRSPDLRQLGFSVSDSETIIDIDQIVSDNPEEFYIPTDFLYQFDIDDEIGVSICSPTTVSMIIKSFDIEVIPLEFAERTYDPYWGLFGVWPRVVTHASEYGLKGTVTRYRTWSDTYEVLKNGGRIAMSVGQPLYSGHLIMLAGFDDSGNPIVHDPAIRNGEAHVYNKRSLSESWFNKGGVSYTFFLDENYTDIQQNSTLAIEPNVYPNPASNFVNIEFNILIPQRVIVSIFDIKGAHITNLLDTKCDSGKNNVTWNINDRKIPNGLYFARLVTGNQVYTKKIVITK